MAATRLLPAAAEAAIKSDRFKLSFLGRHYGDDTLTIDDSKADERNRVLATRTGATTGFEGFAVSIFSPTNTLLASYTLVINGISKSVNLLNADLSGANPSFTFEGTAAVPLPAAAWLLLAGVGGLVGVRRLRT